VTATYRIGDELHETTGVGYHDHNWGNVSLAKIVHDWYWARGQGGPYSVIASLVTAHNRYRYAELPIFMLARQGEVVADDSRSVRFEALDTYTDQSTGKPVAKRTRYTYLGDDERWIVTFTRDRDLAKFRMIDDVHGPKRVLARLATLKPRPAPQTGRQRPLVLWLLFQEGVANECKGRSPDPGSRRRSPPRPVDPGSATQTLRAGPATAP
jgi:hypothetical protein